MRTSLRPATLLALLLAMSATARADQAPATAPAAAPPPRLPLPARVDVAVGRDLTLWTDTLWPADGPPARVKVTCEVGRMSDRGFHFTPASSQVRRAFPAVVEVRTPAGALLASQPFELRVVPRHAAAAPLQILFLGDSLTAAGVLSGEVKRRIEDDGGPPPLLFGYQDNGGANRHEGRGGWGFRSFITPLPFFYRFTASGIAHPPPVMAGYTAGDRLFRIYYKLLEPDADGRWHGDLVCQVRGKENPGLSPSNMPAPAASGTLVAQDRAGDGDTRIAYTRVAYPVPGNPLWDETLHGGRGGVNVRRYLAARRFWGGADRLDVVFVQLGVNDCMGVTIKPESQREPLLNAILADCKTLVAALLDPEHGYPDCRVILALPPIGCHSPETFLANYGPQAPMARYEAHVRSLWARLLREFDQSPRHPRVRIAVNGLVTDRDLGYPAEERTVDGRQRRVHVNAVHPNETGYRQGADAYYGALCGWLADGAP